MERLTRLLAEFVVTRRALAVSIVVLGTLALATQLPKMRSDAAPEKLIGSFSGFDPTVGREFRERFGDSSRVLVFLVEADDVLAAGPLEYQRRLAQAFKWDTHIERIDALTTVPLPRIVEEEPEEEVGLDELEAEGGAPAGDQGAEGLDELEAEETEGRAGAGLPIPSRVLDALVDLTSSDPELFPDGVQGLGERLSKKLRVQPIFGQGEVTEAQSRELVAALPNAPLLERRLYSADRKVAVVALWLRPLEARDMRHFVDQLRGWVAKNPPPEGTRVRISGLPYLRNTIVEQLRTDQLVLIPITVVFMAGILMLTLRWWFGVVMPLLVVACTTLMTVGGMAFFGQPMNVINNIIPTLLIMIGLSCAVHLISRYVEEMGRGSPPKVAAARAVQVITVATFLTSSTTAVGFASNVFSQTVMLRSFGVIAGIGTMISFIVALLLVPPVMVAVRPPRLGSGQGRMVLFEALILRSTSFLLRHPGRVMALSGVLFVACIAASSRVEVDIALLDQFDPQDEVYQTTRILEGHLTGVRPLEVSLWSDQANRFEDPEVIAALERVHAWAIEAHGQGDDAPVIDAMGYSQTLRQTLALLSGREEAWTRPFQSRAEVQALVTILGQRRPSPLDDWLIEGGKRARLQLRLRDIGAKGTMEFAEALDARLHRELDPLGHVRFGFTGEAYDGSLGQRVVIRDLVSSLGTSIVAIFLLLVVLFRSVRLAAVAIPPNLLTLLGTLGYMVVRGIPLSTSTAIVFSVAIGLAVDGSIHVIARFHEEISRGLGPYAALVRTARGTGRAISISQGSLVGGFAVLLLSEFVPVRQFGELMAVTVGAGLVGTLVLQPVLLFFFGIGRKERQARAEEKARLREQVRRTRAEQPGELPDSEPPGLASAANGE